MHLNSRSDKDLRAAEQLSMSDSFLQKLEHAVLENLQNEQFGVEDLANEVAFSRSHLYRKIHGLTGMSISQFIRNIRLAEGHKMLQADVGTVSEISFKVGFGSSTYFSKCFHDTYGYTPGDARLKDDATLLNVKESLASATSNKAPLAPLEFLHPKSDATLIKEVFAIVAKQKPSLAKFLILDEEEGEELDMRLLAYQLIKSFPWPIGVELRRMFSASLEKTGLNRLEQAHHTFQRCLLILVFIFASEIVQLLERQPKALSAEERKKLAALLRKLEPAELLELMNFFHERKELLTVDLTVPEIAENCDAVLLREIAAWKDSTAQDTTELSEAEINEACLAMDQALITILKRCAFLARYKLVNVGQVLLKKPRFAEANFEHHYHFLNSADSDFKVHLELLEAYADTDSVLLMSSIKETQRFLNLSPWLVDTYSGKSAEKLVEIKRDVYLLRKAEGNSFQFEGSETNGLQQLDQWPAFSNWLKVYQNTFRILEEE